MFPYFDQAVKILFKPSLLSRRVTLLRPGGENIFSKPSLLSGRVILLRPGGKTYFFLMLFYLVEVSPNCDQAVKISCSKPSLLSGRVT